MRALVIEDDARIAGFLRRGLREEGYAVEVAGDGEEGLRTALTEPCDVIVLDLMLPKLDGVSVLKRLRRERSTPVLILTARDAVEDRVQGLNAGADDYLVKPFALPELLARLRAILRRGKETDGATLSHAGLQMDLARRTVTRDGKPVELTAREFSLLEYFLRSPEQVLSRSMILEHVWSRQYDGFSNVIDVHVNRLRRKLGDADPEHSVLRSVKGVGYALRKR